MVRSPDNINKVERKKIKNNYKETSFYKKNEKADRRTTVTIREYMISILEWKREWTIGIKEVS